MTGQLSGSSRATGSAHGPRYRVEDGKPCIDISVRHSRQLFDGRDPAPFRDRDLDEDAVAYLLGAVQEIPRHEPLKIVVAVSEEPEPLVAPDVIAEAVRHHFVYERELVERRLREHVRRGRTILAVGVTILVVFLSLAEFVASLAEGPLSTILREGFVITGWVAMWRPVEFLLYDWWPIIDERRQIGRVVDAEIAVRHATPLTPATANSRQGGT